jgi:hypothetical protein
MWPFRKRGATLDQYLSSVADIRVPGSLKSPNITRFKTSYIIFQIRKDDLEELATSLVRAQQIVQQHQGIAWAVLSSISFATFNWPPTVNANDSEARCSRVANALRSEFLGDIRGACAIADGVFANIASESVIKVSPILPGVENTMQRVLQMEYGEIAGAAKED